MFPIEKHHTPFIKRDSVCGERQADRTGPDDMTRDDMDKQTVMNRSVEAGVKTADAENY